MANVAPSGSRRAGVVERLVEAVSAARADGGKALEIAHGAFRIDHGRKRRGVRRDDGVLAQAALQSQAGHAEVRILVGELEVARIVGGFGNAPRNADLRAIADLSLDDQAVGLFQQASGRRAHDERRHEVFEHGARPGNEGGAFADRRDGASEPKPVAGRNVVLGDRDEARQARLGGEQVVAVGVERPVRGTSDRQQAALLIEQKAELHAFGHRARSRFDRRQALLQVAERSQRLHRILASAFHRLVAWPRSKRAVRRPRRHSTRPQACGRCRPASQRGA